MCGIFCECSNKNEEITSDNLLEKCKNLLERRGPNAIRETSIDGIKFFGTVLHHQGIIPTVQPVVKDDFVFLFNGDLFMDLDLNGMSDTEYLANLLENTKDEEMLREIIENLRGPYSLIFYHRVWRKLFFARDPMGRNSLIIGGFNGKIIITSICCYEFADFTVEVPPIGLFCMNVDNVTELSVFPWYDTKSHPFYKSQIDVLNTKLSTNLRVIEDKTISLSWLKPLSMKDFNLNEFLDFPTPQNVPKEVAESCQTFINHLSKSIKDRTTMTSNYCKKCFNPCNHCRIGILFSGGLDCSILAILADKYVPKDQPIDLFNVAFEKVKRVSNFKNKKATVEDQIVNWDVPDRLTAKQTLEELKELRTDRQWNLVEVNVKRSELEQELTNHLRDIISLSKNILDESLGAALWFAARGKGHINEKPYESTCRVLLIGSGADELFAGYSRHRNAFKRATEGKRELLLQEELELDWIRLPNRNLARDDRVISDHSATPRAPYLQEDVIQFVRSLKANQRCNLNLEAGIGDKLFLRLCAQALGLEKCCFFKKRALQFGSRIADSRQKADNVSTYFQD